jgi:hypothetical protein
MLVRRGLHYVLSEPHVWGVKLHGLYQCLPWQQ